jgi:hypothetical protein
MNECLSPAMQMIFWLAIIAFFLSLFPSCDDLTSEKINERKGYYMAKGALRAQREYEDK